MNDAIITGLVAIFVCLINNFVIMSQSKKANDKTVALIEYRLQELAETVKKHNGVIERTYKLEESTALQDAEIKRINRRLEIVEGKK